MAQYEEFNIDRGSDVAIEIHLVNKDGSVKDLTNHAINAKLKKTYTSDSADTLSFNSIVATPSTSGVATISLTNIQTDTLKNGRYVYDVEMSYVDSAGDSIVERVLEGRVQVTPSVTR